MKPDLNWHTCSIAETMQELQTAPEGLILEEVRLRQVQFGPNRLAGKKQKSAFQFFVSQFSDFMILVLLAAAIVSFIAGDSTDSIIILVIVFLNAVVGFFQEYRAEQAMEALKKMATPVATVFRNNQVVQLSAEELVPGDVVMLEAGNTIPADLRLIDTVALRIEESSLTGESLPVDKTATTIGVADIPLGDRVNMAYKGTQVANGRGKGIVTATGMQTEIGKIAALLQQHESATPLQARMKDFGKRLTWIILAICVLVFLSGWFRGEAVMPMLLVAISLAVAAIPEALPALITVSLSKGASLLVRKNALIRKLAAVETLGSVSFICSDKTGTLTQNKMTVVEVHPAPLLLDEKDALDVFHLSMAISHDVRMDGDDQMVGDPTEIAVAVYSKLSTGFHFRQLQQEWPRVAEIPFDAVRKRMTTIHRQDGRLLVITKGAAESLLDVMHADVEKETVAHQVRAVSAKGIRVLLYAYRWLDALPAQVTVDAVERDLQFAGFIGMIDPPREDIERAIEECTNAGIKPVMITGDHPETAAAIARQIGILTAGEKVLTGVELARMDRAQLQKEAEGIAVYARVSPEQKLDIVEALQKQGHFVAMTGDGVNDAPSLKKANIGIAMGITGTDVAKEAAHMILLDDHFATIVNAVREGRRIYDNIRRFVKYIMTCNGAELMIIFLAPFFGLPIPLLPIHILWINLVTDGLPGLALSAEKAEGNVMRRPPRRSGESLFAGGTGRHIIWVGAFMATLTLALQDWSMDSGKTYWQTMVFTSLSIAQLAHVMAIRSEYDYIYRKGLASNPSLLGAVILTVLLQLGVIYLPFANDWFKTQPLLLTDLLICFVPAVLVFHAVELEKLLTRVRRLRKHGG